MEKHVVSALVWYLSWFFFFFFLSFLANEIEEGFCHVKELKLLIFGLYWLKVFECNVQLFIWLSLNVGNEILMRDRIIQIKTMNA